MTSLWLCTRPAFRSASPASIPLLAGPGRSFQDTDFWPVSLVRFTSSRIACSTVTSSGKFLIVWTIFSLVVIVSIGAKLVRFDRNIRGYWLKICGCAFKGHQRPDTPTQYCRALGFAGLLNLKRYFFT